MAKPTNSCSFNIAVEFNPNHDDINLSVQKLSISCPCQQAACGVGVGGQRRVADFGRDQLSEHVVVEIILESIVLNRGNHARTVIRIQVLRSSVFQLRYIVHKTVVREQPARLSGLFE